MNLPKKPVMKFENIPVAPIGLIPMDGSKDIGYLVDKKLSIRRQEACEKDPQFMAFPNYLSESYLLNHSCLRFSNGEGKASLASSTRGKDIYIIVDIGNYSCTYKMFGEEHPMSPDDHYQDLKRIISAIGGKAKRINIIMPMLYESRQHFRSSRESLDCALALQELENLGVDNILTFDAHDPRVQNAVPLIGFENIFPTYQFLKSLIKNVPDILLDRENFMVVSPDEGGMKRSLYYANVLEVDLATFYKRRDYSRVINGRNPIVKHEFLGDNVDGKDVLIVDDIISSGESILEVCSEIKSRGAKRVFAAVTFPLFTSGIDAFTKAYEEGYICKVFSSNLTYRTPELLSAPWYADIDMSKFIAYLIDTLNNDQSISTLINPLDKINNILKGHKKLV